jgi:hypothetical protein
MKTAKYNCPHCEAEITTQIPTSEQVTDKGYWDSLRACSQCRKVYFFKIWPDGLVKLTIDGLKGFKITDNVKIK